MKPIKPEIKSLKTIHEDKSAQAKPKGPPVIDEDMSDILPGVDMHAPVPEAVPNPVELPAPINPEGGRKQSVEFHRNLFCPHYDECLDEAVKRGWNSFTCLRCSFYHEGREETQDGGVVRFATQRKAV